MVEMEQVAAWEAGRSSFLILGLGLGLTEPAAAWEAGHSSFLILRRVYHGLTTCGLIYLSAHDDGRCETANVCV